MSNLWGHVAGEFPPTLLSPSKHNPNNKNNNGLTVPGVSFFELVIYQKEKKPERMFAIPLGEVTMGRLIKDISV